jgi:hypothetical protein
MLLKLVVVLVVGLVFGFIVGNRSAKGEGAAAVAEAKKLAAKVDPKI